MKAAIKVLIADTNRLVAGELLQFLVLQGFESHLVTSAKDTLEYIEMWRPDFVVTDLLLGDMPATALIAQINKLYGDQSYQPRVIVVSAHNNVKNVEKVLKAGALDYVVKPFKMEHFLNRLVFHMQEKAKLKDISISPTEKVEAGNVDTGNYYLHLTDLILKEAMSLGSVIERLNHLVQMVGMPLGAIRCSLIRCPGQGMQAEVIVSSDNKDVRGLVLDLNKYPEVLFVRVNQRPVAVQNIDTDPILIRIRKNFKNISFNSIIVAPVMTGRVFFGVVSVRLNEKRTINEQEIRYVQLVGDTMGLILKYEEKMIA